MNKAAQISARQIPNYRIYDRTGGGVTQDIYAESLEAAIEAGREWIEDGDWSGSGWEIETDLPCCVREIVRVPDLRSIEALPGVCEVRVVNGNTIEIETDEDSELVLRGLAPKGAGAMIPGLRREVELIVGVGVMITADLHSLPMKIDETATNEGDPYDCTGHYTPTAN